jgi:hypothetical protein
MVDMYIRFGMFMKEGLRTEREYIPPVAPHITYDLGLKLDQDIPFMREGRIQPLYFNADESTFVANALRTMINTNQISWFVPTMRSTAIENWRELLETAITLYRLDRMVNGERARMTAQDIIDLQQSAADQFKRSPEKREFFKMVGIEYELKYTASGVDGLFFALARTGETLAIDHSVGIFDIPGRLMNLDVLGYDYDVPFWSVEPGRRVEIIPRTGYFKSARDYYNARSVTSRSASILPYNRNLDQTMDKMMREWIGGELNSVRNYHEATIAYLNQVVKRPVEDRPRIDFNGAISITSPLLSDSVVNDFTKRVSDFNAVTGNCFVQTSCPDFR